MNRPLAAPRPTSRREFLIGSGALVVSFSMPVASADMPASGKGRWPAVVDKEALDSWLAVSEDGRVIAAVGKIEAGMGIGTSFAQIVAEELDVALEHVTIAMGDTATTVDQRGTGSSNGIIDGGAALRSAGAEARQALLGMASRRLGIAVDQLSVSDGVVSQAGATDRSVSYAELIGGKRFDIKVTGKAKPKATGSYRIVGKPIPRHDIPLKVAGLYPYLVDFKVPGMVHGRVIRPPQAGASLLSYDRNQRLPGLIKVVARGNFLGVVCEREEQAVKAAAQLRTTWSTPEPMFEKSYDDLYRSLREAVPKATEDKQKVGDVEVAFAEAPTKLDVQYEYPFQSHACMGPACAIADVGVNHASVWVGGQKPYPLRKAVAGLLQMPSENVRVTWLPGPGSYGMNDADDAAIDAVILAHASGRPVRLQYTRADATAWDPKGPPSAIRMRGALDAERKVVAYNFESRGFSGRIRPSGTGSFGDSLAAQLIGGYEAASSDLFHLPSEAYVFPNKRRAAHLVSWEKSLNTGLRTAHLRDPDGMATCFASECFIDEMAFAAQADPVEFRLRYLTDPRHRAVITAAASGAGWQARPSPRVRKAGSIVTGRGIAYAPRAGAVVAIVAEVEVDMDSGKCRVTRFVAAHDCGFVINPLSVIGTVEANLIQAMSRALHEEVRFNARQVTSVDWMSYPIVDMTEIPDSVEVIIVNNVAESPSKGAGEPATRPVAAVIGNAIFDATGVRIRRVPFTPSTLIAAFREHRESATRA